MTSCEDLVIVKVPDPGQGHELAEETATLILQGLGGVLIPSRRQVMQILATELNGHLSIAAVNSEGIVAGTGGLLYLEKLNVAAIIDVVVRPSERKKGLGAKIMSALEEEAWKLDVEEIFGQPEPGYIAYYERLGYQLGRRPYIDGDVLIKQM